MSAPTQILETADMIINPYRYSGASGFNFETEVSSANCVWWVEAGPDCEVSAGVPAVNGETIAYWRDKSSNGNDWSQATAGSRPRFDAVDAKFNGGPGVYFAGTAALESLAVPNVSSLTAGDIFILYYLSDETPPTGLTGFWNLGTSVDNTHHPWTDGFIYDSFGSTVRKTTGNPTDNLENSTICEAISVSGEWTLNINGTQHYTTATNTVAFPSLGWVGASNWPAAYRMQGKVAACILYDGKLDSTDRTAVYNALNEMRS